MRQIIINTNEDDNDISIIVKVDCQTKFTKVIPKLSEATDEDKTFYTKLKRIVDNYGD